MYILIYILNIYILFIHILIYSYLTCRDAFIRTPYPFAPARGANRITACLLRFVVEIVCHKPH